MRSRIGGRLGALLALCLTCAPPAWTAEEERQLGWSDTAELSLVATAGNARAQTLGFRNALKRVWPRAELLFVAAGLRAETTTESRFAVVTAPGRFELRERSESEVTAERYRLRSRYDRSLSERVFAYGEAGWERNQFAGLQNRYSAAAGVGHLWLDGERTELRTDYGLSWTREEGAGAGAGEESFLGVRLSSSLKHRLSDSAELGQTLVVDGNLDRTSDYRAEAETWLSAKLNGRLALKVGLDLLFDNRPRSELVPLLEEDGTPTGDSVAAELEKLDSILTVAIVLDF